MIPSLLITIGIESIVVLGYSVWRKKPVRPMLLTSIGGNLVTQSFLWVVLNLFFWRYFITLLVAEILIWIIESTLLYFVPANRLPVREAVFLSLYMNLASFTLGLLLPI